MAGKPPRSPANLLEAQSSMKKNQKIRIKGDKKKIDIFFCVAAESERRFPPRSDTETLDGCLCSKQDSLCFLYFLLLCLSPQSKAKEKKRKKKKSFLSLMADSHKFVLNMSSIDPSCQMKTIKEMALSAAHLGAKMEGLKKEACGRETGMKSEGVREDVCVWLLVRLQLVCLCL